MASVQLHGKWASQWPVAHCDPADLPLVRRYRWHVYPIDGTPYARSKVDGRQVYMHQLLTGFSKTDHADGDGLNNRRSNLREGSESQHNTNIRGHGRSRYRGVDLYRGRWRARCGGRESSRDVGLFDTETEAALAYDAAAKIVHGKWARLNFPEAA